MLTRVSTVVVAILTMLLYAIPPATAGSCPDGSDPIEQQTCDSHGCTVALTCPSTDGGDGGGGENGGKGSETCSVDGRTIPCRIGNAPWNGTCYVTDLAQSPQQAPPTGQKKEDGKWYACIYPPGLPGPKPAWAWVRTDTPVIDPAVLGRQAVAAMNLKPIEIGIVPESGDDKMGLIGLPTWMWVKNPTPNTYGPITRSASDRGLTVTATARVSKVEWDMGDKTPSVICSQGTPYSDGYGKQDSPTCGHRYERTSLGQAHNAYTVTATSYWEIEWSGGGMSGTMSFDRTNDTQIRVGELQVLIQR